MSRRDGREPGALVYGGVPRARLMPPEVAMQKKERGRRRGLVTAVIGVVLVMAAGVVASTLFATNAAVRLAEERLTTEQLLAQQLEFTEVTQVRGQLQAITDVRGQLAAVEVLWQEQLTPYLAVLTEEDEIDTLTFRANAPAEPALELTGPLRSPRVATIRMVVISTELPEPSQWFREWEKIDTFADASIDSITLLDDAYQTTVTINLNDLALSQRFSDGEVSE